LSACSQRLRELSHITCKLVGANEAVANARITEPRFLIYRRASAWIAHKFYQPAAIAAFGAA